MRGRLTSTDRFPSLYRVEASRLDPMDGLNDGDPFAIFNMNIVDSETSENFNRYFEDIFRALTVEKLSAEQSSNLWNS